MKQILFEKSSGIGIITLNRPEKLNALAGTMREDLAECFQDPRPRAFIITGAGQGFCAGGDLETMASLRQKGDRDGFRRILDAGRQVVLAIRRLNKPVLAAVNGVASGAGCNLALACDLRIASPNATFVQSFARIGLHPDWAGTVTLPALAGRGRAAEMFLTGEPIDAAAAHAAGIVNRVVPAETLLNEALLWAERAGQSAPLAVAAIKRSLGSPEELDRALDREIEAQLRLFESEDFAEGLAAFREKRPPTFRGR